MGYKQWTDISLINKSRSRTFKISYLDTPWGKLYNGPDDKDTEIQPASFVNRTIPPGGSIHVYACGRSDSASGTDGNITIADNENGAEIVNVYFSCPYSGSNEFKKTRENNQDYIVALSACDNNGALGEQSVQIAYLG